MATRDRRELRADLMVAWPGQRPHERLLRTVSLLRARHLGEAIVVATNMVQVPRRHQERRAGHTLIENETLDLGRTSKHPIRPMPLLLQAEFTLIGLLRWGHLDRPISHLQDHPRIATADIRTPATGLPPVLEETWVLPRQTLVCQLVRHLSMTGLAEEATDGN